ncbi:hypothetical protein [Streptomyces murinus]|uniref:hypothetical protein n=1 Tax=Streptomyces murinus TaxID=33900 RepID=UPI003F44D220
MLYPAAQVTAPAGGHLAGAGARGAAVWVHHCLRLTRGESTAVAAEVPRALSSRLVATAVTS